jgi:long-chain fatty acid transport protein
MKKTLPILTLSLLPMLTMAAGFQINEDSPRLQGQAMAGSASAVGDVTAIFNNPALLATIKQKQVYLGGGYIAPHISVRNAKAEHAANGWGLDKGDALDPVDGKTSQSDVASSAFVPVFYTALPINPDLTAGLSITAPWGLTTHYDKDSVLRFMSQKTALKTINIDPMLAYQVNSQLSFGMGVQVQYAKAELSNFDGPATNVLKIPNLLATTPTSLSGDGWATGYNLGLLFQPTSSTSIGLSYRSQINYTLKGHGTQYMNASPLDPMCSLTTSPTGCNAASTATAALNTPAVVNFSITQKLNDRWSVSTTEQYTLWHSLQNIKITMPQAYADHVTINTNWNNSMLFSMGTDYKATKALTLRSGLAYDQTPSVDLNRDARIPDTNRVWLTLGSSYNVNDKLSIDAAYEHIFMQNQSIDVEESIGQHSTGGLKPLSPLEKNKVQADYKGSADIFSFGLNYKF